jgi:non-ribosomal peptide synthetase component F
MRIFSDELATLYRAFTDGQPSPLREPTFQFADYAFWERQSLTNNAFNEQLTYWNKQLAGPFPRLEFRKAVEQEPPLSFRSGNLTFQLDENSFAAVKAIGVIEDCTPFMILLAALNLLLCFQTGSQDIWVGSLVANRGRRVLGGAIGHFLNTIILRNQISFELTIKEFLKRVRNVAVSAYARQDLPFEHLTDILKRDFQMSQSCRLQVCVNYRSYETDSRHNSGTVFAPLNLEQSQVAPGLLITGCDLIFNMRESSTALTGTVNYKTEIFDEATVAEMVANFHKIVELLVFERKQPISDLFLAMSR